MISSMLQDWQSYWFRPAPIRNVVWVRVAVCLWAAIWFASFLPSASVWFGANGILDPSLSSLMIDYEGCSSWQLWSPLWLVDSPTAVCAFLYAGIFVAFFAAAGYGGRWSIGVLLIFVLSLTHRMVWLISMVEPALVAFVAYLLVEPGPPLLSTKHEIEFSPWARTTLRLMQTHWWILIAAGVLSQMADLIWWRGDAVWWLASAQRSVLLSTEWLYDHPLQANALTHGLVCVEILALWLIVVRSTRWIGIAMALLAAFGIGLVADQILYGTLMCCPLIAYAVSPSESAK